MPTLEEQVKELQAQMRRAMATTSALQGQPADATLSIPHNDTFPYADNVDGAGGFAGNLRYVIASNVQRVVSARLSIHLAPYRTYNSLSFANTGAGTAHHHTHSHTEAAHKHDVLSVAPGGPSGAANYEITDEGGLGFTFNVTAPLGFAGGHLPSANGNGSGTGSNATDESAHTHPVPGANVLGVTEGTTAAAVTIAFDGADHTADLGGPFSADVIELNVLPFLPLSKAVFHTIAMLPSGLGRIEAHLRLGVYVSAGSAF